jgi:hypothetical protein
MRNNLGALLLLVLSITLFSNCSSHGDKVEINSKSEVYIKNGGTREDAKRLGDFLLQNSYFDSTTEKAVQLSKSKDTFVVKFIIDEEKFKNTPQADIGFQFMHMLLRDSVFAGQPTKVLLTNNKFETIETVKAFSKEDVDALNLAPDSTIGQ